MRRAATLINGELMLTPVALPPPSVRASDPYAQAVAGYLATVEGGAASDYELIYERTATVPASGETLWVGKYVDAATGTISTVYRDGRGTVAGEQTLGERESAALAAQPALEAKGDEALLGAVAAAPAEPLHVAVWLEADAGAAVQAVVAAHPEVTWLGDRPVIDDLEQLRAIRAELYEARAATYAAAASAFGSEVAALGGEVAYASTSAPLVFVDLPAPAAAAVAERPEVASLGLEASWAPQMSSANPTVQANWTGGAGDQGDGVRVAVVEYHNVRASGDLGGQVVASHSTSGALAYTAGVFDHPTWVAGAIASKNGTFTGVAPGADIVSSSTGGYQPSLATDRAIVAAADWAIQPAGGDADIVNTSVVQDTAQGAEEARRYFDSIAWEAGRLPVSASGNLSALGTWDVGSPGTGYNVLTVGGTDDRGSGSWTDDRLWYVPGSNGASYRDPAGTPWNAHGDYNKPNVSAPAVNVVTANGLGASGTSVATPIVSGIAAQLIARAPSLAAWPEAVRAIVMAGAIHRIPMPDGSINVDHEGTGTVSALWSNRILVAGDGTYGGYVFGTLSGGSSRQIGVVAGQRVRVALAWSSHTSGAQNAKSDTLASDLDLRVRHPNGAVSGSYTIDNSYEWVDITAQATGQMTIEIVPTRLAAGEPFALAWTKWNVGTPTRLGGANRYATAAVVSRTGYAPNVPAAFITTGENFPDALAGAPAAATLRAPLLLVQGNRIPAETAGELSRLRPQRIYVLGSAGVVSDAVLEGLRSYTPSRRVDRLAGPDRYATAAQISEAIFSGGAPMAFIATGQNFPDALAAGPAAAVNASPVLLTQYGELPAATAAELRRLQPKEIVILGSAAGAVSAQVETALRAFSPKVTRVAGPDRYATAAAIVGRFFPSASDVFLATGRNFPDALAGSAYAGRDRRPLLLTATAELTAPTRGQLARLDPARTWLLGSSAVVGDAVVSELWWLLSVK
jgi:putative cell wall-binding protein